MPFVVKLQSLIEFRLQGLAPPELVSIAAELFVAAALFCPLVATVVVAGWLLKRLKPAH
jgi:hypothetical protein